MIEGLILSIISSAVYDCLKSGVIYIKKETFEQNIQNNLGSKISSDEVVNLYNTANEILKEVRAIHNNSIEKEEELLSIIRSYVSSDLPILNSRVYYSVLQRADEYFENETYDQALKFYNKAELYCEDNEELSYILWKKFLCHLAVENYYQYVVEYNNCYYDLRQIYNYCDYNTTKTISTIRSQLQLSSKNSRELFACMINGRDCPFAARRFATKKEYFDMGLKSYSLTTNPIEKQLRLELLEICVTTS